MVFSWIIWVVAVVCAIWVIYDVLTKQRKMSGAHKVIWVICALLFSIITAIVYALVIKK